MVKRELTDALVKAFPGITRGDMSEVTRILFESMAQALIRREAIEVRGIGRFSVKRHAATRGKNPKTGIAVHVPARLAVHFKPAGSLTKLINQ